MKNVRKFFCAIAMCAMFLGLSQCKSIYQLEDNSDMVFGEAYYQTWVAGIEGGGSGINLFIPVISKPEEIELDSLYFRGKKSTVEWSKSNMIIGRFTSIAYNKKDLIMTNEPYGEYGNHVPKISENIPFELEENECVLSYIENGQLKFMKISGIEKREPKFYPSAPQKDE